MSTRSHRLSARDSALLHLSAQPVLRRDALLIHEDPGQLLVHGVKGSLRGHLLPQEDADEPQPEGLSEMRGGCLIPQQLADEPVPRAPTFCFRISWQTKL